MHCYSQLVMLITVTVRQVTVPILVLGSFLVVLSPVLVNTIGCRQAY